MLRCCGLALHTLSLVFILQCRLVLDLLLLWGVVGVSYEGTGRSLSLKLVKDLREQSSIVKNSNTKVSAGGWLHHQFIVWHWLFVSVAVSVWV